MTIRYNVSDSDGVDVTWVAFPRGPEGTTTWPSPLVDSPLVEGSSTNGTYAITFTVPDKPAGSYPLEIYVRDVLWNQKIYNFGVFEISG